MLEPLSSWEAERSASIGDTRAARRAGNNAAPIVTPTPTTKATTMVDTVTTLGPEGSSMPNPANRERMPLASSTPSPSPTSAEITPTTAASIATVPSTWLRTAPIARIRPSSWVRCAIRIEKEL